MSGPKGARTWSEALYGFAAEACAPGQLWCQIMVAPWSISHRSPCQTSMLGLRHERSTLLISASNQTIRPASAGPDLVGERIEAERSGQEVHPEVQPAARLEELLHLLVRLGETDDGVELDGHQLRHPQPQPPAELPADDLRDQGLAALPGSGELHDVRPEVVGLDDARGASHLHAGA